MLTAIYGFAVQPLINFTLQNKWTLLFYLAIIFIIFLFRHKLEWQAPLMALYKTQVGVKAMKYWSEKHRELIKWLGYVGIGVGFTGMIIIVLLLVQGLFKLFFVPDAPPTISLVIPGFTIAGTNIAIPLIHGWIALFVVIVVHEFSHGIVSKAHGIPIKSSGILIFGPLLGAFVEPDEKKLLAAPDHVQYSMFAAGPFSNILSWAFFSVIYLLIGFLVLAMTVPAGIELSSVEAGSPAAIAGLTTGMTVIEARGYPVENTEEFLATLETLRSGDNVSFLADGTNYEVIAGAREGSISDKGVLGITFTNKREPAQTGTFFGILTSIVNNVYLFLKWVIILNLGIGLANLLPLGPVDGGQMMRRLMTRLYGEEKGLKRWKNITKIVLFIIIVLLIVPFIKGFF